jgi:hypothetical protein
MEKGTRDIQLTKVADKGRITSISLPIAMGSMQTYEDGRYRLRKNFERGLRHFCFNQVALGRGLASQD